MIVPYSIIRYCNRTNSSSRNLPRQSGREIFNWSLAGVVAVLVVAIPILLLVNMDILSGVIARQIPAAWEAELGESTLPGLRDENALMDKDRSDRLLSPLVNPLVSTVSNNRYDFDFNIINNAELNAFALPGGYVVIHSGLILTADSAEELLGVLAHEISHVTEQHGIKNIIGSAGIYLILSALLGDLTGILGTITSASYLLLNQSYSRRFESDADQKGHDLLVAAGINPRGLGSFFEKLIEEEQKLLEMIESDETRSLVERSLGFLSSHPATGDRIENLRDMWENESGDYLDLDEPFRILKTEVEQFVLKTNKESTGDENSD